MYAFSTRALVLRLHRTLAWVLSMSHHLTEANVPGANETKRQDPLPAQDTGFILPTNMTHTIIGKKVISLSCIHKFSTSDMLPRKKKRNLNFYPYRVFIQKQRW